MRMWKVDPKLMCNRHLMGEHVELHMFVGVLNKNKNIKGYIVGQLMEVHSIRKRHDELVAEMVSRGIHHKSILPDFNERVEGQVDIEANQRELYRRCEKCRERQSRDDHVAANVMIGGAGEGWSGGTVEK